ncbi:unnamed protein product [Peronospora farinosa]|uniref:RING-type domain-containing protein n=1 Tax=Peronospora farinosa TaxID=134698 RepID=A0ABN8BUG2_9STRA|nr:unnamed protein product [Peronospora farinosa]
MLHQQLLLTLHHGHFCNAACPWLYSFLSTRFPRKHIFQRSSSSRTVQARREKLLLLLTSTLDFLLNKKNYACNIAINDVAKLFAEFLYGEDAVAQYIVKYKSEATSSNNHSQHRSVGVLHGDEELAGSILNNKPGQQSGFIICGVCNGPVACRVKGDSHVSLLNASRRRRSSAYAITLQCGHQFHDECIVPVLNETLRCPTCYHLEIQ